MATVAANVDQAGERLQFARTSLDQARQQAAAPTPAESTLPLPGPATHGAPAQPAAAAVLAAGAAQEAADQARTLLDAIDRTAADLATAVNQLTSSIGSVDQELATVPGRAGFRAAPARTRRSIRAQLDQIQAILSVARSPHGAADPMTALHKVEEADLALDGILASTRSAQQQEQRSRAALTQALTTARAEVGAAEDFVNTRRGAVGSQARTRLAEAKRHLANAEAGSRRRRGGGGRGAAGRRAGPRGVGPGPAGRRRIRRRWLRRRPAWWWPGRRGARRNRAGRRPELRPTRSGRGGWGGGFGGGGGAVAVSAEAVVVAAASAGAGGGAGGGHSGGSGRF